MIAIREELLYNVFRSPGPPDIFYRPGRKKEVTTIMESLKKIVKSYPVLALAVAVTLIFCIVVGAKYINNDQRSPEMTLTKYYEAFYLDMNIDALKECVTTELHETLESTYGMPYIGDTTVLTMYAQAAMDTVGYQDFNMELEVLSNERSSAEVLGNVRKTYTDATAYHILTFQVTWSGDLGTQTQYGETCLVKRADGRWYMVESQIYLYNQL